MTTKPPGLGTRPGPRRSAAGCGREGDVRWRRLGQVIRVRVGWGEARGIGRAGKASWWVREGETRRWRLGQVTRMRASLQSGFRRRPRISSASLRAFLSAPLRFFRCHTHAVGILSQAHPPHVLEVPGPGARPQTPGAPPTWGVLSRLLSHLSLALPSSPASDTPQRRTSRMQAPHLTVAPLTHLTFVTLLSSP